MTTTTTYRQKDSGWQIIVSWKDADGKWHQKSKQGFAKKADAKAAEADLIAQIKKAPRPVEKAMAGITLREFCIEYLKTRKDLVYITKKHYTNAVDSVPDLADKPLAQITYLDVSSAVAKWKAKPATQSGWQIILNVLFKTAVRPYRILADNPMEGIKIEKERRTEARRCLSEDEQKKMFAVVSKLNHGDMALAILLCTGLRKGEMLALTWDDIDWKNNTLHISKQFSHTHTGHWQTNTPKSRNGYREIPMPAKLIQILKHAHNSIPMDIKKRLFPAPHSTYRDIQIALKKTAPDLTPHCLRHTYATNLLAHGMDVQTLAALLGDNVNTVIRTYIHYSDEMRKAAADNIQKIFAQNF